MKAIWSPHTGIVDWALVTQKFGEWAKEQRAFALGKVDLRFNYCRDFQRLDGEILYNWALRGISQSEDPEYPVRLVGSTDDQVDI